ncbi:hypothetical protein HYC85_030090 [Camellia sinensis]|uniref:GOST seven transmembrane domain-containing protein n=1 Tax=Camellia sinensis TaxID=4442 RepID=A0A7J7FZX5_CAMSI|nr:hypothetical protein HYC85_030090 [Camellia sinensis]
MKEGTMVVWISALNLTESAKRSSVKLDIYRKFSNALAGTVIALVAWIGYETKAEIPTAWRRLPECLVDENDEELPDFCKFYEKCHKSKKMNNWIDPRCGDLHVRI